MKSILIALILLFPVEDKPFYLCGGCPESSHCKYFSDIIINPNGKYLLSFDYLIPLNYDDGTEFILTMSYYQDTAMGWKILNKEDIKLKDTEATWKHYYKIIKYPIGTTSISIKFAVQNNIHYEFAGDLWVKNMKIAGGHDNNP